MGKTTFLHSCLKTIALRGRRYPSVTISYCSFSRVSWQVEHRHVQHIRKWCGQQHEPLEAFSPLELFRVKWISLFEITRKGWSLTSTVFKTRKRNIMKTFKIKTSTSATQSKMAADVRKLSRSIWTSSPYAMATKLGKSKSDDTATKFGSKKKG